MPVLLCLFTGIVAFFLSRFFPFSSIFLFSAAAFLLIRRKQGLLLVVFAGGFLYALILSPSTAGPFGPWDRNVEVKGKFLAQGRTSGTGPDIRPFMVEQAVDTDTGQEIEELEDEKIWVRSDAEFDPEETYDLLIRTGNDRTRLNPGSSNRAPVFADIREAHRHGEDKRAFGGLFDPSRLSLHKFIQGRFSRDSADFLSAVTIGETHLGEDLKSAFNATGLAHMLSISGTHFGLFSVVVFGLFSALIKRLPYDLLQRLTIHISPSQAAALLCLPLMAFYLGMSGGSVPAVRSFIMISMFLVGLLINRKGFWLNTILLAAVLLALWDPEVILSLSFQLSFLAVIFIGFAVEQDNRENGGEEKKARKRSYNFIMTSIRISFAATAGTALLVAYHFHYFSIISPLSNLIVAPLIGFVVIPLAVISSFTYLLTGAYLFAPLVSAGTDLSLWLVRTLAAMPFADIATPAFPPVLLILFYAFFLPYLGWRDKKKLLVLPFLPLLAYMLFSFLSPRELSVTFLDVGQGDAAVVELPDGKTLAIDTGRTGREVAVYLGYIGRRKLDILAITHSHPDHAGGTSYIMERVPVRERWDNGRIAYAEDRVPPYKRRALERGDLIKGEAYRMTVLHPYHEFSSLKQDEYVEGNNASLVLKLSGRRHSFLFLGDVEEEAEDDLVHLGVVLKSDVVKIPHHGGRTSMHQELLSMISPSIAVISVGRGNTFGHPSPEVMEALSGNRRYRTDLDGAIKITETEKGLSVKTYRNHWLEKANNSTEELRNLKNLFTRW